MGENLALQGAYEPGMLRPLTEPTQILQGHLPSSLEAGTLPSDVVAGTPFWQGQRSSQ